MKISISLPSLFPNLLYGALERIYATIGAHDVEIVVVSPFEIAGADIKWVREERPQGNCAAHALAYEHSSGDILVTLTDDLIPEAGWLDAIVAHLRDGERMNPYFVSGLHNTLGSLGTVFGLYYPYLPVLSRHTLRAIGGYFSRDYAAHFGDADLALRVWRMGGRCAPCFDARVSNAQGREDLPESSHKSEARARDAETFLAKWKDIYGVGWSTARLQHYNIDIFEHVVPYVLQDGTIQLNDPKFAEIIHGHYRALHLNHALTKQQR